MPCFQERTGHTYPPEPKREPKPEQEPEREPARLPDKVKVGG